jgi:DNA replication protein DnaC
VSSPEKLNVSAFVERMRRMAEEHEHRMANDPAYRAEQDRIAADHREQEAFFARIEADRKRKATESRRESDGIPRRLWALIDDPSKLDDSGALQAARAFKASRKTFLVLAGGVGPGKTVAAAWAAEDRRGMFVKAIDLTRTGTYNEERWEELRSAPFLAIDDLGTEPRDDKGWAAANFEALLDHRYDWELPTVMTTNLPFDAFRARYLTADGGRLNDRFREVGEFVELAEGSRRVALP